MKRLTIVLDSTMIKDIKELQALQIILQDRSVSFSDVTRKLLEKGLSEVRYPDRRKK